MSGILSASYFLSSFSRVARRARSAAVMSTAVAAAILGMNRTSFAIPSSLGTAADVTSITTTMTAGTPSTLTNQAGYGASYSVFKAANSYTLNYLGEDDSIKTVTAGTLGTYMISGTGTAVVRRSSTGGNNDNIWYDGSGNGSNHSTVTLDGPLLSGFNQAFTSNNILVGADNVFSNRGNAVGNNTNVDRIDLLFTGGILASTASAFSIFDRGPSNDHDSFKIAAITSLGSTGLPTSYGQLQSFSDGTWGKTAVVPNQQENITRKNDAVAGSTLHPSDLTTQTLGGVLIQTSDLAPIGTKIYGYSLFSGAVTGTGNQLVDWTNTTYFPPADSTSTGGGLDPTATLSALYTAVPEPTTGTLMLAGLTGLIARRPKRAAAR